MNTKAKTTPPSLSLRMAWALMAGASLALSACAPASSVPAEPPLAGADIGGPFNLINSASEPVTWEDFRGEYAVIYFGYAYCPDVCPTDMQRTAQGMRLFAEQAPDRAAKTQVAFISIDPARDTPEVVGEFAAAFSDDIIGLTGTPDTVKAAADAFRVYYQLGEPAPGGGYLVDHTNIVYLFDPDGEPLAMLPTSEGADAVAAELDKWVN
ncbi:MAG: SCO family protein [Pseudomonadota bacterium]